MPAPQFTVEEVPNLHLHAEHELQAETLRAQLNFVGAMGFRSPALVFHRQHNFPEGRSREVHPIGDPRNLQSRVRDRQGRNRAHPGSADRGGIIDPPMQQLSFDGRAVVSPQPFAVNQRALARTVQVVLQR